MRSILNILNQNSLEKLYIQNHRQFYLNMKNCRQYIVFIIKSALKRDSGYYISLKRIIKK